MGRAARNSHRNMFYGSGLFRLFENKVQQQRLYCVALVVCSRGTTLYSIDGFGGAWQAIGQSVGR